MIVCAYISGFIYGGIINHDEIVLLRLDIAYDRRLLMGQAPLSSVIALAQRHAAAELWPIHPILRVKHY